MKVSVIIPLYNGIRYVDKLITMMKNNYDNLSKDHYMEVIFVKDSDEEFDKNIFNVNYKNLPIILLENYRNFGIHYSRVRGIEHSSGKYIHMLDQDDSISDDFLENGLNNIANADILVCNGKKQYDDYYKILYKFYFMQLTVKYKWFYTKFSCRILSPGQCIIKKSEIPKEWMENLLKNSGSDDFFLWLLMLEKKKKFKLNRKIGYIHNDSGNNLSSDDSKMRASVNEVVDICVKNKYIDSASIARIKKSINKERKSVLVKVIEFINIER